MLRGAAGITAVGAGLTTTTGSALGREGQGGSGVVAPHTWQRHDTNTASRFKIIDKLGLQEFTCNGTTRTWACYRIEFENQPTAEAHNLLMNSDRRVDTVEGGPYPKGRGYQSQDGYTGWHEFTGNPRTCTHYDGGLIVGGHEQEQAFRVSFKPTQNANGKRNKHGTQR
ncbi:hypothetical protein [Halocatena pleomorpha]|nr:hypothetical protein [Halocatena pleomorpha]